MDSMIGEQHNPEFGVMQTLHSGPNRAETHVMKSARQIIKENIATITEHKKIPNAEKLARSKGVGGSTFNGAKHGSANTTIDNIEKIAKALGVKPWQLLFPNFDPVKHSDYERIGEEAIAFARTVAEDAQKLSEHIQKHEIHKKI